MKKKEVEMKTYSFIDKYGIAIWSLRAAASKKTLENLKDEFKYRYDLKELSIAHAADFVKFIHANGITTDKAVEIEWK